MKIYRDEDADLSLLDGKQIVVIGYGNQGRAQALNLRDSGLDVIVGNQEDEYFQRALQEGFSAQPIPQAVAVGDVVMLLIPDEVLPETFETQVAEQLKPEAALVFASGFNVAFEFLVPPAKLDVILVAPRMVGAGVRDLYLAGKGFNSFIGVWQDATGRAKDLTLAIARGIGSTRSGVVEVTFTQEAELDLFTEQCFGPAFGQVLVGAVELLIEAGYPPEAVLLELYMSGEFSYTLGKIAELGMVEQTALHSRTSQYGSLSRGLRFVLPELRQRMEQGLGEIRSGEFAREWAAEHSAGYPNLEFLRETARSLPLYQLERNLRQRLGDVSSYHPDTDHQRDRGSPAKGITSAHGISDGEQAKHKRNDQRGVIHWFSERFRRGAGKSEPVKKPDAKEELLGEELLREVLSDFLQRVEEDERLRSFAQGREITSCYVLTDLGMEFHLCFADGDITSGLGPPPKEPQVRLETTSHVLDGMFSGRIDATRAALTGQIRFQGDARLALSIQRVQGDLLRLYTQAKEGVLAAQKDK